jgi:hypothetical protein
MSLPPESPNRTPAPTKPEAGTPQRGLRSLFGIGLLGIGLIATVAWVSFLTYVVGFELWNLL